MGSDLGLQYIIDGSGNYYRVNGSNQLVAAASKEEATVFTFFDANQRIGSGKRARFYQTIPVDDTAFTSEEIDTDFESGANDTDKETGSVLLVRGKDSNVNIIELQNSIQPLPDDLELKESEQLNNIVQMKYDISGIDWLDYMNLFCYLANSAKNYQEELAEKQSVVEREICDLLHYIELYDLSEEESMNSVDLIKDARMRRRYIKDEIKKVELFQKSIGTSSNVAKAKTCAIELGKMENRAYHPRELKELFVGMESKKTGKNAVGQENNNVSVLIPAEEPKQEEEQMEYCRRETIFDGRDNNWNELAKQQYDFFANVQQYMINLKIDLDEIDNTIEVVLLEIEDANYNVTQGYKAFKELKDLRNERKEKISELEKLRVIVDCFDCESMAEAYEYASETISSMEEEKHETAENTAV